MSILTGYELSGSAVSTLDGDGESRENDLQFGVYRGVSKESFLNGQTAVALKRRRTQGQPRSYKILRITSGVGNPFDKNYAGRKRSLRWHRISSLSETTPLTVPPLIHVRHRFLK